MVVQASVLFEHRGPYTLPPGVTVVHLSGDGERCVCTVSGGSELDRACALVGMSGWFDAQPEIVARSESALALRCLCPARGVTPAVWGAGASVLWPVVHVGRVEHWQIVAQDAEQIGDALARMRERGDVQLARLTTSPPHELARAYSDATLAAALSPRQLDILRFAIERGYYEHPRRTTIARLARERGVARSTLQEHLQKAEQRVMQRVAEALPPSAAPRRAPRRRRRG